MYMDVATPRSGYMTFNVDQPITSEMISQHIRDPVYEVFKKENWRFKIVSL